VLYIQRSRTVCSHYEFLDIYKEANQLTSVSADLPITVPCRDIYQLHQHTNFTQNFARDDSVSALALLFCSNTSMLSLNCS